MRANALRQIAYITEYLIGDSFDSIFEGERVNGICGDKEGDRNASPHVFVDHPRGCLDCRAHYRVSLRIGVAARRRQIPTRGAGLDSSWSCSLAAKNRRQKLWITRTPSSQAVMVHSAAVYGISGFGLLGEQH
jgi:hypothetical protein